MLLTCIYILSRFSTRHDGNQTLNTRNRSTGCITWWRVAESKRENVATFRVVARTSAVRPWIVELKRETCTWKPRWKQISNPPQYYRPIKQHIG